MQEGIYNGNQPEQLAKFLAHQQHQLHATGQIQDSKPPNQEIPEEVDKLSSFISLTSDLLSALHQRLAPIMPPASPEKTSGANGNGRTPSSPLGNVLSDFSSKVHQHNDSIRYLLERMKL